MNADEIVKKASELTDAAFDSYWIDMHAAMLRDGADPEEAEAVVTTMRLETQLIKAREFRFLRRQLEET